MPSLFDMAEPAAASVSQVTAQVARTLERQFNAVVVLGEVSSLSRAGSGHVYFNLKDKFAVLRAVVWKSVAERLDFVPEDGLEVVARGRISVYAPRGDYQLLVDSLTPHGAGRQDLALRKLKEKLQKLGYFAPERKRPLPRIPRRIALVTSPRGAAVRDMLEVLGRRWPAAAVLVCPVSVQGDDAPLRIAATLDAVSRSRAVDVVVLGRGGGSADDLAAFNHERVAQAIFRCSMPVVSAVGHEIDVTIADLVADRRALTPSEAAELITPDRTETLRWLAAVGRRLSDLTTGRVRLARQRLEELESRPAFRRPLDRVRERSRRVDECDERLRLAWLRRVERARERLAALAGQLDALSPLQVLARGYSLTRTADGRVVREAAQVSVGESVEIRLASGRLSATVDALSAE